MGLGVLVSVDVAPGAEAGVCGGTVPNAVLVIPDVIEYIGMGVGGGRCPGGRVADIRTAQGGMDNRLNQRVLTEACTRSDGFSACKHRLMYGSRVLPR